MKIQGNTYPIEGDIKITSFSKTLAFVKRDLIINLSYKLNFFSHYVNILFIVVVLYFVSQIFAGSQAVSSIANDYFSFVLVGVALLGYLNTSLNSFSQAFRMAQVSGTLEYMLVTPTRVSQIVFSSGMYNFIITSLDILIYLVIGSVLFYLDLARMNILSFSLILLLTIVTFSSLGIIDAAFVILFRKGGVLSQFVTILFSLFGGVFYPAEVLPPAMATVSRYIPITYSLEAARLSLFRGYSVAMLLPQILMLCLFAILMLPASILAFNAAVKIVKKTGSLTQY
ncbi:MAG: ABC transporter permease [archaeon]